MESFGERLQKIRLSRKMMGAELAEKLGMSAQTYSALEKGRSGKTLEKLPIIAKALGCRIDDLFPEMDDPAAKRMEPDAQAAAAPEDEEDEWAGLDL